MDGLNTSMAMESVGVMYREEGYNPTVDCTIDSVLRQFLIWPLRYVDNSNDTFWAIDAHCVTTTSCYAVTQRMCDRCVNIKEGVVKV